MESDTPSSYDLNLAPTIYYGLKRFAAEENYLISGWTLG
jgi:hypothetical protein